MCNCSDTKELLERNARLAVLLRNLTHNYHNGLHETGNDARHWKECDDECCHKVHIFLDEFTAKDKT